MKHLSISLIILISFAISAESNDINTSGFEEKKTYITCSRGSARGYLPLGQKEAARMKKVLIILNNKPSNSEETLSASISFLPRDISFVEFNEQKLESETRIFKVKENVMGFVVRSNISFTKYEDYYLNDDDWDSYRLDRKTLHFDYKDWIKDEGLRLLNDDDWDSYRLDRKTLRLHYATNFKKKCEVIDYSEYKRLAVEEIDKNMSRGIKELKKQIKKNKEKKENII